MKDSPSPLIKLPSEVQSAIFLIKEELKCRKLFQAFHSVGLDDCYFQPRLDTLILNTIGLTNISDEIFDTYISILDRRCEKIEDNDESITRQALKVYWELLELKKSGSSV